MYIGVKQVQAAPMTRGEYNAYRGWDVPADEDPADDGYLVEYLDGGKSNHPKHKGYISWSPRSVFERAYRETTGLSFGLAIEAAKDGLRIARDGWNGKGMFVVYVEKDAWDVFMQGNVGHLPLRGFLAMKTADDKVVPWVASQTDILADDWEVV